MVVMYTMAIRSSDGSLTTVSGRDTCGAISTSVLIARQTLFGSITETCVVSSITVFRTTVDTAVFSVGVGRASEAQTKGEGHV